MPQIGARASRKRGGAMKWTKTITMRRTSFAASSVVLALAACHSGECARRALGEPDGRAHLVWRRQHPPHGRRPIGVWISTGPNRTNTETNGITSYPAYS